MFIVISAQTVIGTIATVLGSVVLYIILWKQLTHKQQRTDRNNKTQISSEFRLILLYKAIEYTESGIK